MALGARRIARQPPSVRDAAAMRCLGQSVVGLVQRLVGFDQIDRLSASENSSAGMSRLRRDRAREISATETYRVNKRAERIGA